MAQKFHLEITEINSETFGLLNDGQEKLLLHYGTVLDGINGLLATLELLDLATLRECKSISGFALLERAAIPSLRRQRPRVTAMAYCNALVISSKDLVEETDVARTYAMELRRQNMDLEMRTQQLAVQTARSLNDAKLAKEVATKHLQVQETQRQVLRTEMTLKTKAAGDLATEKAKTDKDKKWWSKCGRGIVYSAAAVPTILLLPVIGPLTIAAVAVTSVVTSVAAVETHNDSLEDKQMNLGTKIKDAKCHIDNLEQLQVAQRSQIQKHEELITKASGNMKEAHETLGQIRRNQLQRSCIDYETLRTMAHNISTHAFQLQSHITSLNRADDLSMRDQILAQLRTTQQTGIDMKKMIFKGQPRLLERSLAKPYWTTFTAKLCGEMIIVMCWIFEQLFKQMSVVLLWTMKQHPGNLGADSSFETTESGCGVGVMVLLIVILGIMCIPEVVSTWYWEVRSEK